MSQTSGQAPLWALAKALSRSVSDIKKLCVNGTTTFHQVANGMYDFMENEDVYWENKTHATDLFGQRAIEVIKQQVQVEIRELLVAYFGTMIHAAGIPK